jgi:hypothetical protein
MELEIDLRIKVGIEFEIWVDLGHAKLQDDLFFGTDRCIACPDNHSILQWVTC